jgi:DNA-binding NarL/FixJ family response regulator
MKQEHDLNCVMAVLDPHADLAVIGIDSGYYGAIRLAQAEQPDIAVIDYQLDDGGLDAISIIKRKSPGTAIILVSPYDDEWRARDALNRGVSGYLVWKSDINILVSTIYMVHAGGCYISYRIVARAFRALPKLLLYRKFYQGLFPQGKSLFPASRDSQDLSLTEWQIICLLGQGKSTKEIGESLNLKMGTVRNYISILMQKTGIHNRHRMAFFVLNNNSPPKAGRVNTANEQNQYSMHDAVHAGHA